MGIQTGEHSGTGTLVTAGILTHLAKTQHPVTRPCVNIDPTPQCSGWPPTPAHSLGTFLQGLDEHQLEGVDIFQVPHQGRHVGGTQPGGESEYEGPACPPPPLLPGPRSCPHSLLTALQRPQVGGEHGLKLLRIFVLCLQNIL